MAPPKIVVVEDERIVALALQDQLVRAGYEVVGNVGSGEEALDVVADTEPDIVIMDIKLAGELDGVETARRLAGFSLAAVIFLTAYSDEEFIRRARSTLPYGYLLKPVAENAIRPAIEMALSRRSYDMQQLGDVMASIDNVLGELQPLVDRLSVLRNPPTICTKCSRAHDVDGSWDDVVSVLQRRLNLRFPTAVCDDCRTLRLVPTSSAGEND